MNDANELHNTLDAGHWAKAFCARYPSALCQIEGDEGVTDGDDFEHIMLGWFANAIMAGVDRTTNTLTTHALAMVAAEMEACAEICDQERQNTAMLTSNPPQSAACVAARNRIRARTPDDAQAALDALLKAEREAGRVEGLKEAASKAAAMREEAPTSPAMQHGDKIESAILALIEKETGQ